MERPNVVRAHANRQQRDTFKARAWLTAGMVVAAAPLIVLPAAVSPALVLPVYCLLALGVAGIAAGTAYLRGAAAQADRLTAWDIAGGFALIGFAAGILSEPA